MAKCSYCNRMFEDYEGTIVVDSVTANVRHFCSSKCRKNAVLGRKKKKWTKV
ncbi:MAG: 50S ribosomal protein L24e [Candidatus Pacearchaeota archaeon]|nr:50S ribosomal protein L24e [Candidatus Pacearchaeota archaeon]